MSVPARRAFPPPPASARALLLRAHPLRGSFNDALADAWRDGAFAAGAEVETIDVADLDFDPALRVAHREPQPLEPDLVALQASIAAAAHLTIAWPVWWGGTPAALKGLIDRTFLPGWAYRCGESAFPEGGLKGRSGRVVITMDAPSWWDRLRYGRSAARQVRDATLRFCGVAPLSTSIFAGIESTTPAQREAMLERARRAGAKDGGRLVARFPARLLGAQAA